MPIIPNNSNVSSEDRDADTIVSGTKKLAVANTSETLFTIAAGFEGRAIDLANDTGAGSAYVHLIAGAAATVADFAVEAGDSLSLSGLQLPAGTYAFIGDAGKRPTVRFVVSCSAVAP